MTAIDAVAPQGNYAALEQRLDEVKDKQGFIGEVWNGVKEVTNLGQSESDCDSILEQYAKKDISFDEALEYIEDYENKQNDMTNLFANIATGVGAIALTMGTGGTAALAMAAPVGAVIKAGVKTIDRATNDISGDELDAKVILKDGVSGAITGVTSVMSSHVKEGIKAAKAGLSIANGIKWGSLCGAISGSSSYMTDVVFGDRKFNFGDLTKNTLSSAFVSGTVGGTVGGGMYALANRAGNIGAAAIISDEAMTNTQRIIQDSLSSTTRKVLGEVERSILAT